MTNKQKRIQERNKAFRKKHKIGKKDQGCLTTLIQNILIYSLIFCSGLLSYRLSVIFELSPLPLFLTILIFPVSLLAGFFDSYKRPNLQDLADAAEFARFALMLGSIIELFFYFFTDQGRQIKEAALQNSPAAGLLTLIAYLSFILLFSLTKLICQHYHEKKNSA